ncbi:hypothetical protein P22_3821 [Propionispora sp. 2/2-37]|uniref:DUF1634 domain-containing protein n=1 Tax=Propionispora sp. 2/2-37 TaxID=1677858 RepID=UPI0006BB9587|nr:DUF1634 domain-containing protein [Propionispora sp. 2/2-37]CUH97686.1 hypothetical protein P22_3821 [Propionispora sp. 2/2-37]
MSKEQEQAHYDRDAEMREVELFVSRSLRFGVILSAGVILIGLLLFLGTGEGGYPGQSYPTRFTEMVNGALQLKPFAVILTGLLLLILTPVLRVAVSTLIFIKEKDWLYVGISAAVFLILLFSLVLGK